MRVVPRVVGFKVVQVAPHHGDELRCVFQCVCADERRIAPRPHMAESAGLYCIWPLQVPPEPCFWAVTPRGREAGVTVRDPGGYAWDQV